MENHQVIYHAIWLTEITVTVVVIAIFDIVIGKVNVWIARKLIQCFANQLPSIHIIIGTGRVATVISRIL
ncbi:Uncharacterised protein [Vibrio cholerae]|uniref:Uncharacterized protein n=1 Tax=Vibrio cholerae TaxID=666 RepID=A0A655WV16_VIBCL|nr:Uncharacterised protein [Vibrio cholerae]CSC21211.1 Uncharacterised protein [Vibrio cholerae]CSD07416.1 Uncharacterised protein [Vibrio cholerae]